MSANAFTLALSFLCIGNTVLAKLGAPGGPLKKHYDFPDVFEVVSEYKDAMSISDSDNDTIFDCLLTNRTEVDYEARTFKYVWTSQGADGSPQEEVLMTGMPGPTSGSVRFFVEGDPTMRDALIYYSDKSCSIMDVEYHGHQCILWVKRNLKDTVPQVCIDNFMDICGVVIKPGRRDLCDDGEGDY
ncbi:uncharacterized protein LOC119179845 isoform X1 [Rhipicephalus microplus]|uniref:uncharacterized protein LOC119179845 isoform X1 n=1 Tax=Rhipicephalus microplus TaxID=6941 RepID=UPI003F6BAAF9